MKRWIVYLMLSFLLLAPVMTAQERTPVPATITTLTSAARTATTTPAVFTQMGYRGIRVYLDVTAIPAVPGALTAGTPTAGGACTAGTHSYKVTFVISGTETIGGTTSNQITCVTTTGQTVPLSAIPLGPTGTTARKLYRTVTGDTGNHKLLTTVSDNVTTTFDDTVADGSLGADVPATQSGGLKVIVRVKQPVSGVMIDLNTGGALILTAVTRMYEVYPNAAAASGFIQDAVSRQLSADFDIRVTHDDAQSYTYSLAFELLL